MTEFMNKNNITRPSNKISIKRVIAFALICLCFITSIFMGGNKVNAQESPYNLDRHVTNVKVSRKTGTGWSPTTTVNDGDQVKVEIGYSIPTGIVTNENPTLTYQVPGAIKLEKYMSGTVYNNGENAGTYTINQDGFITITFDNNFLNAHKDSQGKVNGLDGTVQFLGIVSKESGGNKNHINFPGTGSSINIYVPPAKITDIKSSKKGVISQDKRKITYTVVVSSDKGTSGPVNVRDSLYNIEPRNLGYSFDLSSVKVVDSYNKTLYYNKYNYENKEIKLSEVKEGNQIKGFELSNLPQLSKGYKYTITYDVNITAIPEGTMEVRLDNSAWTNSGDDSHTSIEHIKWSKDIIKSGSFNPNGEGYGEVNWSITINPDGKNLRNWIVQDKVEHQIKDGKARLVNLNNGRIIELNNGDGLSKNGSGWTIYYKFDNYNISSIDYDFNDTYRLEYTTIVPQGTKEVRNTVEKWGDKYESDTGVVVTKQQTSVQKWSYGSTLDSNNENRTINKWQAGVNIEPNTGSPFTFVDTFEKIIKMPDKTELGDDSHYAYASELEKELIDNLRITSYENEGYVYQGNGKTPKRVTSIYNYNNVTSINVIYYDKNGEIIPSTDNTKKVKSFKINIAYLSYFSPKYLDTGKYHTYSDITDINNEQKIKIPNTAQVGDKKFTVETEYEKHGMLEKGVFTGYEGYNPAYKTGKQKLEYSKENQQIEYRLMLTTSEADGKYGDNPGTLVVKDTLPDGAEYVQNSLEAAIYRPEALHDLKGTKTNSYGTDFSAKSKPTIKIDEVNGKKVATITIPNYTCNPNYPMVQIFYKLDISKDKFWNIGEGSKIYKNDVVWKNYKSSSEVSVEKNLPKLSKQGWQVEDNGNPTGKLKYNLIINSKGEDLLPNSDQLVLEDKLEYIPEQIKFDISLVKLYKYDGTKDDKKGEEIDKNRYMLTFDAKTLELKLTLPDGLACVFEYEYELINFIGSTRVENKANLSGIAESTDATILKESESGATVTVREIKIYKVDSKDINKFLPGTKFKLEKNKTTWDGYKWISLWESEKYKNNETVNIPESGMMEWSLSGGNIGLEAGRLYRLTELESLDGYSNLSEPVYFIWIGDKSEYEAWTGENRPDQSGIPKEKINFFGSSGGILYIKNEYTKLKVNKFWQDVNGDEYRDDKLPDKEVIVDLYRRAGVNGEYHKVEGESKTLTKANKYSGAWGNLPQRDNSGKQYYYKVLEKNVDGYETSYFNNEGISSGEINIFNKKIKTTGFELPGTGGRGTGIIYSFAIALIVFVAMTRLIKHQKTKKI
ncbi:Cna B-type domain-containing protein [Eubacteriales bacterium KG127]